MILRFIPNFFGFISKIAKYLIASIGFILFMAITAFGGFLVFGESKMLETFVANLNNIFESTLITMSQIRNVGMIIFAVGASVSGIFILSWILNLIFFKSTSGVKYPRFGKDRNKKIDKVIEKLNSKKN